MELERWAFGGVLISAVMIGLTAFIVSGLAEYEVTDNVQSGELEKLESIENSTSIAQKAQQRAEQAEARSNFFTLPNIVNLLRLPFESVPIWETFSDVGMSVLGLHKAPQYWPMLLVSSYILIKISYKFAARVL